MDSLIDNEDLRKRIKGAYVSDVLSNRWNSKTNPDNEMTLDFHVYVQDFMSSKIDQLMVFMKIHIKTNILLLRTKHFFPDDKICG